MRSPGLVLLVSIAAAVGAAPAAHAAPRTPAQCARALNCGAEEINLMPMQQRLELVRAMAAGPGARFGAQSRWRNIEGVITFFRDKGWGETPGSWVSYVDAGIVEGIERGLAIASGRRGGDFGNPGARLWASYLTRLRAGELRSRAAHDRAWGEAEQVSTDHGVYLAVTVHGVPPTDVEQRFMDFSQLYRTIMRNKEDTANVVALYGQLSGQSEVTFRSTNFVDWFTDVGNIVPSRKGCEMAWRFANLDLIGGVFGALDIFLTSLPDLFQQYLADQQRAGARASSRSPHAEPPAVTITREQLRRVAPNLARELSGLR